MNRVSRQPRPGHLRPLLQLLPLALLLLLLAGAQGVFACEKSLGGLRQTANPQITGCHGAYPVTAAAFCCDSAACHRNTAPLRHLGKPGFANQIKGLQPLLSESRQTSPQPRVGAAISVLSNPHQPTGQNTFTVISTRPRLALSMLKTTVLLH